MRILVISNEGARTGAPALLLNLIRWMKAHHPVEIVAVLMRDGSLRPDFEKTVRTYTWIPTDLNRPERLHRRLARLLLERDRADPGDWLARILEREKPDLLYLSTLVLGKYLGSLVGRPHPRIVTHVHELLPSLRQLSSDALVQRQLDLSDTVISCAACVQSALLSTYDLAAERCRMLPEFIRIDPLPAPSSEQEAAGAALVAEDLPPSPELATALQRLDAARARGVPVFGIGGTPIARKGFDLIPLLLQACRQQFGGGDFLFVWIGCAEGSAAQIGVEWDVSRMGLTDHLLLISSVPMATFRQLLSRLQVLTLLSREDPFPLVVLEAGLLEVPTVCFAGSGAIADMAEEGICERVDYLDLNAFAAAVQRLCLRPEEAKAIGARCRRKVTEELSLEKVAPRLAEVLLGDADAGASSTRISDASAGV